MRKALLLGVGLFLSIFLVGLSQKLDLAQNSTNTGAPKSTANATSTKSSMVANNSSENVPKATNNPTKKTISQIKSTIQPTGKTPKTEVIANGKSYPNRKYTTFIVPNDPLSNQWWVAPNGMNTVWDLPAGAYQTKVAVIDTGFALAHQEFVGRWVTNSGESGATTQEAPSKLNCTDQGKPIDKSCNLIDDDFDGVVDNESGATTDQNPSKLNCTDQSKTLDKSCNNIDDDGNGYVDDVTGWDFSNGDANVQAGELNPNGSSITHGTMTSGVLGANGNNGVGIAGVNWQTKILPLEALDDNGYGDSYTVGQAVYYATNQGADVISISLGTNADDPYLRDAIHYALDHGSIVVAASGNSGCNCISYPANYPEVIAVGAISSSGSVASFSNYGPNLDILAPGQGIYAPSFSSANPTSLYASNVAGTSFSTPFVSGLLAYGKSLQPNAKWEEIIGAMFENSNKTGLSYSAPRTDTLGFGVSMANNMLSRLNTPTTFSQRYQVNDIDLLGSKLAYQCSSNQIASTRLYELTKAGQYRYTANMRELSKAISTGWSTNQIAYTCMGLPTDTVSNVRAFNLLQELHNGSLKTSL